MEKTEKAIETIKQSIIEILKNYSGSKEDIAYLIYNNAIINSGNEPLAMALFFEISEEIESNNKKHAEKVFSEEEKYQLTLTYGKMIDGALEALLRRGLSKADFYGELWSFINESKMLSDKKLKAFTLYYLWIDVRLPYFELEDGIKMSNEDFIDISKNLTEEIKRIRFILNTPTDQKTERASRLVNMIENLVSQEEKTVLMAHILRLNDKSDIIFSRMFPDGSKGAEEE
ncbi:MAG TPA: hypothetical protein H9743_03125 [Candidatus Mediterraneibacter vanvlietii]|nr:hypothetical protein [Candidatus Mediterraneibacter vanvlietii]